MNGVPTTPAFFPAVLIVKLVPTVAGLAEVTTVIDNLVLFAVETVTAGVSVEMLKKNIFVLTKYGT